MLKKLMAVPCTGSMERLETTCFQEPWNGLFRNPFSKAPGFHETGLCGSTRPYGSSTL